MRKSRQRDTASWLDALIEEAIVDAYGEAEQHAAFGVILDERLELPFTTQILCLEVTVRTIEQDDAGQIVAICVRGSARQKVSILDPPLPSPAPKGAEWIEAYRRWLQHGHDDSSSGVRRPRRGDDVVCARPTWPSAVGGNGVHAYIA